jgi:hypothetical protein
MLLNRIAGVIKPAGRIAIADLDSDEEKFHDSTAGVFHLGFDRHTMMKSFEGAGFSSIRNRTAAIFKTRTFRGDADVCDNFDDRGENGLSYPPECAFLTSHPRFWVL